MSILLGLAGLAALPLLAVCYGRPRLGAQLTVALLWLLTLCLAFLAVVFDSSYCLVHAVLLGSLAITAYSTLVQDGGATTKERRD